jgi:hypothetical protein
VRRETKRSIKSRGGEQALEVRVADFAQLKVKNFFREQISLLDQNHCMIIILKIKKKLQ